MLYYGVFPLALWQLQSGWFLKKESRLFLGLWTNPLHLKSYHHSKIKGWEEIRMKWSEFRRFVRESKRIQNCRIKLSLEGRLGWTLYFQIYFEFNWFINKLRISSWLRLGTTGPLLDFSISSNSFFRSPNMPWPCQIFWKFQVSLQWDQSFYFLSALLLKLLNCLPLWKI